MSWRSDVAPTLNEGDVRLRPLKASDARAWQEVRRRNQAWLGPWDATVPDEGVRAGEVPPSFHAMTRRLRAEAREGRVLPWATEFRGRLVGQITMGGIAYGSLRSAYIGYWIDQEFAGRGVTSMGVSGTEQWLTLNADVGEIPYTAGSCEDGCSGGCASGGGMAAFWVSLSLALAARRRRD